MPNLILMKAYPPHVGHQYLIDFAWNFSNADLNVFVAGLKSEIIPVEWRGKAISEEFGSKSQMMKRFCVFWNDEDMPQYPEEDENFWPKWKKYIEENTGTTYAKSDFLFASEKYGEKLAEVLGMTFIPVDIDRKIFPTSGTLVRENIKDRFKHIILPMRKKLIKTIAIVGPESTGKTTLSEKFKFDCSVVPEFARGFLTQIGERNITPETMMQIAYGQTASFKAVKDRANHLFVIEDTPVLMTYIWWKYLLPNDPIPEKLELMARRENRDAWIVLKENIPFVKDPLRYENDRMFGHEEVTKTLELFGKPYTIIESSDHYDRYLEMRKIMEGLKVWHS